MTLTFHYFWGHISNCAYSIGQSCFQHLCCSKITELQNLARVKQEHTDTNKQTNKQTKAVKMIHISTDISSEGYPGTLSIRFFWDRENPTG